MGWIVFKALVDSFFGLFGITPVQKARTEEKRVERMQEIYFLQAQDVISESPARFVKWALEAVLGIESGDKNVLMRDSYLQPLANSSVAIENKIMARAYLDRLSYKGEAPGEFTNLTDYVINRINLTRSVVSQRYAQPGAENLVRTLFADLNEQFGEALSRTMMMIVHGIPIYTRDGRDYIPVPDHDPLYIYLRFRFEQGDESVFYSFPPWAMPLHFRTQHIEAYERLFAGDLRPDQLDALQSAFRALIGKTDVPRITRTGRVAHRTRMMDLMDIIILRYYGERFDLADPDTHTLQTTVIRWLKDTYNLSNKEAMSIDTMTRPDSIRNKS